MTTSTTRLKGKALLQRAFAKASEINDGNREALAIECGYKSKSRDGQVQADINAFCIELAHASGLW